MIEFAQWCTVFCSGNEADGEVRLEWPNGGALELPICQSCLQVLQDHPEKLLDLSPGPVLEFDPEEEALGLIPEK